MQSTQVPIWIPLAVALLGFIGIIGGQIVNGWRESKKLVREETYRRLAHWRDTRLDLYSELVALAHDSADNLSWFLTRIEDTTPIATSIDQHEQLNKLRAKMLILASPSVFDRFTQYRDLLLATTKPCISLHEGKISQEEAKEQVVILHEAVTKLAMAMRKDLGVFT